MLLLKKAGDFYFRIFRRISSITLKIYFFVNKVQYNNDIVSLGIPNLEIAGYSKCAFGEKVILINSAKYSKLGKCNKCKIAVGENASLIVGNSVGMSNVVIVATNSIIIGNNVMIGGGVTIVDSDFHSLNPLHWHTNEDEKNMKSIPVIIKDNVFIGMDSIILKGVTIGNNVIIAAGSIVSKDIPNNQIWGGNPARFIKYNKIKE